MGNSCRHTDEIVDPKASSDPLSSESSSGGQLVSISVKQDVNAASAEALTVAKGIGKTLALRIVEFRDKNGPFESMDGLLSVSGVGASKLQALEDKFDVMSTSSAGGKRRLDINTATVQQLQSVQPINEALAKEIIGHREKWGEFSSIDELRNVQGIRQSEVETLRDYLEVRNVKKDEECIKKKDGKGSSSDGKVRRRHVMRIGSWNLERFSSEKASNEGVLEVICTTILKYRYSVGTSPFWCNLYSNLVCHEFV